MPHSLPAAGRGLACRVIWVRTRGTAQRLAVVGLAGDTLLRERIAPWPSPTSSGCCAAPACFRKPRAISAESERPLQVLPFLDSVRPPGRTTSPDCAEPVCSWGPEPPCAQTSPSPAAD